MGIGNNIGGGSNINQLGGVQIISPTNGQTLVYNSTDQLWENSNSSGATGYATIEGNGTSVAQQTTVNFIGTGVTVTNNSGANRTDVTIGSSTSYYQTVQAAGVSKTQEAALNFLGTNITVADNSGNGSTDISVSGTINWNVVTTSVTMAIDNGYINNSGSLITLSIPATVAAGHVFRVAGYGSGLWEISQNTGQVIHFGNATTTTGASGYLKASNAYDSIHLVCVVANTTFVVVSSVGNILIN